MIYEKETEKLFAHGEIWIQFIRQRWMWHRSVPRLLFVWLCSAMTTQDPTPAHNLLHFYVGFTTCRTGRISEESSPSNLFSSLPEPMYFQSKKRIFFFFSTISPNDMDNFPEYISRMPYVWSPLPIQTRRGWGERILKRGRVGYVSSLKSNSNR